MRKDKHTYMNIKEIWWKKMKQRLWMGPKAPFFFFFFFFLFYFLIFFSILIFFYFWLEAITVTPIKWLTILVKVSRKWTGNVGIIPFPVLPNGAQTKPSYWTLSLLPKNLSVAKENSRSQHSQFHLVEVTIFCYK